MCGIAGFVDREFLDRGNAAQFALVHRMCDVIRHRGPDDEGIYVEPRRRPRDAPAQHHRSCRRPAADPQRRPKRSGSSSTARSTTSASCARELEALGHRFYTSSDTETIVHAYEQWGDEAFGRLRGMFGIAMWDAPARTLLLARDRVGSKPLHYVERGGRLYFGSEIKSLIAAGAVAPRRSTCGALDHYLVVPLHAARRIDLRGRQEAAAGTFPAWRDGRVDVRRYWRNIGGRAVRGIRGGRGRRAAIACCRTPSVRTW